MFSSHCCFLTCIQISQEAGQVVWYCHLFQNFPKFMVIQTVKGFGIANKAEIEIFLKLLLFRWSSGCWQFICSSLMWAKLTLPLSIIYMYVVSAHQNTVTLHWINYNHKVTMSEKFKKSSVTLCHHHSLQIMVQVPNRIPRTQYLTSIKDAA